MSIHLAHRQVTTAFDIGPDRPGQLGVITEVDPSGRITVERLGQLDPVSVTADDPAALLATLERADLCRYRDRPLVVVSASTGVLGIATGPAEAPSPLAINRIVEWENGRAVAVPGDEGQPSWQLHALVQPD